VTAATRADAFRALPLRCHALLHDVPLHDVWVIDLAGGGPGRTLRDVDGIPGLARPGPRPLAVRALFAVRAALGRLFGWDTPRRKRLDDAYFRRLSDADRARSRVTPGTPRGIFRLFYVFDDESLGEARNATVHAFLVTALRPHGDGYQLYWAIYVRPVGWLTPIYMALIDPFRRSIIYPALVRQIAAAWTQAYVRG
jgi:hypothetical protein